MADLVDDDDGQHRDPKSSDKFPEGLRVLVWDEDPAYLLILDNHLQEFQYQVTRCNDEEKAMYLLRNHSNKFDIALIEVQNPDGDDDKFRLISEIGSETDIPIIVMSNDDSVDSVISWIKNGACDYLVKPINPEDLRLLFKHVVKKRKEKPSYDDDDVVEVEEEKGDDETEKSSSSVGDSTVRNPNKRKRESAEIKEEEENNYEASTSKKRRRVVWDEELHEKFIKAIEYLGPDKAVPKKILEVMGVKGITRENVASHLQKYRMNQKKQKEREGDDQERNQSLVTDQQQGRMSKEEEATDQFYNEYHHIPMPSCVHQSTNPSVTTHHHHHDGVSHPADHNQNQNQTSELPYIGENLEGNACYNMDNEEEAVIACNTSWFTPNTEALEWFTSEVQNNHPLCSSSSSLEVTQPQMIKPEPPMFFPSYGSLHDQQEFPMMGPDENGGINYNNSYSVQSNMAKRI